MPDAVEFDPVDTIAAGAVGEPGGRSFYIQATKDSALLSVLVEKEQVAALAERIDALLTQAALEHPEDAVEVEASLSLPAELSEPLEPLFRAVAMGIGFDADRIMILLELYEQPPEGEDEGRVARLFATRSQMRAMALKAAEAVMSGRPPCPYCGLPLDADGHTCPAMNGHRRG